MIIKLINGRSQTNRNQKSNLLFFSTTWSIPKISNQTLQKKHYKEINIYDIGYISFKKIDDSENIDSVNSLPLLVNHASRYIEEKNGNKCLIFDDSANENKRLLKNYADMWGGIKNKIKTINDGKENDYRNDSRKIKFNSDDDLPLNKPLKFHVMTIITRSVFEESGKLCPPVFLDYALYELRI